MGIASYLCLLSLQTQEARVHHGVPWGLRVLSGLWVLPCQDLLKVGVVNLTVRVPCQPTGSLSSAERWPRASSRSLVSLPPQPGSAQDQSDPMAGGYLTPCLCPKSVSPFSVRRLRAGFALMPQVARCPCPPVCLFSFQPSLSTFWDFGFAGPLCSECAPRSVPALPSPFSNSLLNSPSFSVVVTAVF